MTIYKIAFSDMQLAGKLPNGHTEGAAIPEVVTGWRTPDDAYNWAIQFGASRDRDHARTKFSQVVDSNGGKLTAENLYTVFADYYHRRRFSRFNASFENEQLIQPDIAWKIKQGYAFTTWHRNQWRESANYEVGQHLALDFDAGDVTSSLPHLLKDKFVQQYAALAYSTPSSQPEAPKSRVVFVLDTPIMQAKNYVLASKAMLWLFGTADPKCKDPCRFFYGSLNCELSFLNHVLPLDKVKEIINQYIQTGAEAKQTHEAPRQDVNFDGDAGRLIRYWQRRLESARSGERNDTLNKAAYSLGELVRAGALPSHEVYSVLEPAAMRAGLQRAEIANTIRSGLRKWAA